MQQKEIIDDVPQCHHDIHYINQDYVKSYAFCQKSSSTRALPTCKALFIVFVIICRFLLNWRRCIWDLFPSPILSKIWMVENSVWWWRLKQRQRRQKRKKTQGRRGSRDTLILLFNVVWYDMILICFCNKQFLSISKQASNNE